MNIHYTSDYLLNPTHPITINLIGCGGTGIQVLNGLGRMHEALIRLGHMGLEVTVFDPDKVTESNAGRQLFSSSDIGQYKCCIALTRLNRFFGTQWEANPTVYIPEMQETYPNIIISCVDRISTRLAIDTYSKVADKHDYHVQNQVPYYWLDYGNMQSSGQVVLGTMQSIKQPKSKHNVFSELKTVIDLFPNITEQPEDDEPSCSIAEALNRQDLFINSTIAQYGLALLWKLLREAFITFQGMFLNLQTFQTNPILIK